MDYKFAEVRYKLLDAPFTITILLRSEGKYALYDDKMKKYINMTAYQYVEDLTTTPFNKTYSFYKEFRACKNEDY